MNRLTGAGSLKSFVITIAFIFLFTVALLLDVQYLYMMSVMLALVQPVSWAFVAFMASRYGTERRHGLTAVEDRPFRVHLAVTARGGVPASMVRLEDALGPGLERVGDSGAQALDIWDGNVGKLTYMARPLLRGYHQLGPTRMEMTDPLGLFSFVADLAGTSRVLVHPAPLPVRESVLGGDGIFGVRERDGKARRGDGLEFHGVREYQPGDSLRRVHWRTSARTGRLAVVEFERAYEQNVVVALDLQRGTEQGVGRESSFEYGVKVAATLIDRILRLGGGVTLLTQAGSITVKPQERDPEVARHQLFDLLAQVQPDQTQPLVELLRSRSLAPGAHLNLISGLRSSALEGYALERLRLGDRVRFYYCEPVSFGAVGEPQRPGLPNASVRLIEKKHSPWEDGGKHLEFLLES